MSSAPVLPPERTSETRTASFSSHARQYRSGSPADGRTSGHPDRIVVARLGGIQVHLMSFQLALANIMERAASGVSTPLAVASANLDHISHFGQGRKWEGTLEAGTATEWLTLLDGAPLVAQAERVTGLKWPRLAGSDLSWPILTAANNANLRVGFLGGSPAAHGLARKRLAVELPGLVVAGFWAPERSDLGDPIASRRLAAEVADANVDVLFVCLGKPRQELWINEYAHFTGAKVLLAFGAVVDFLAGTVRRAPETLRDAGLEWAWRLALEPKRLGARYLVDGPPAYVRLRSSKGAAEQATSGGQDEQQVRTPDPHRVQGNFTGRESPARVAVVIVTYNSGETAPLLIADLRRETADQSIKVIIADNSPSSSTVDELAGSVDVTVFRTGGNLGYAAGINLAIQQAGTADAYLVLNPDLRLDQGCVATMYRKMQHSHAGAVVPLLRDADGRTYHSLRREPTILRAVGDALMGSKLQPRPGWFSETDFVQESYKYAHRVEWATGAAVMIAGHVARKVGDWDEQYFLYSEETDYLRRVRDAGASVWFEPAARMSHTGGASGTSSALEDLMATNKVRYVRKFRPAAYARLFHAAVILGAALRAPLPGRGSALPVLADETRWAGLPHSDGVLAPALMPQGSVVIPAHDEAAVLRRTLSHLAPYAKAGRLEVVVVCNACTDATAAIAREHPDVRVLEIPMASKVAALNAGDAAAVMWPRLYLDADIELRPAALAAVFSALGDGALMAARPDFEYHTDSAQWLVRAYYRARSAMPSQRAHLWGAGAYAVNARGHGRISTFPELTADDLYVDSLFSTSEKAIIHTMPAIVRTPRTIKALDSVLRRTYRGNAEQAKTTGTRMRLGELRRTVRGPRTAVDALVYAAFALHGRLAGSLGRRRTPWERDNSSRSG